MLFNNTMKWIESFVPMNIKLVKSSEKAAKGSSKRAAGKLEQEDAKRQRIKEENESTKLKRCLEIIPDNDDDDVTTEATPLSSKSPTIVDYKIYKEGRKSFLKIIRADDNSQNYLTFRKMFKNFNKEDLEVLLSFKAIDQSLMLVKIFLMILRYPDALLVKDRVSDNKDYLVESSIVVEKKTDVLTIGKVEFVRLKQQEKPVRKPVKYAEMYRSQGPRGNQRNWNNLKSQQLGNNFVMYNKASFVCGSFEHVQANCNYHQRKRVITRNNYTRVHSNNSTRKTHPNAHRNMAPKAVLMKTDLRPLNTARPVNTAHPKTIVKSARPMPRVVNTARPRLVNTARPNSAVVSAVRVNQVKQSSMVGFGEMIQYNLTTGLGPIGIEGCASWVWAQGTVPVGASVREGSMGEMEFRRESGLRVG
nr:retrotransposon Orf1 [Tanacetum cinerariifolium]